MVVVSGAIVPVLGSSASAEAVRTTVIDRTLVCTTAAIGGAGRDLDVVSAPDTIGGYTGTRSTIPAYAHVSSGAATLDSYLVALRSGPLTGISRILPAGVYASSRWCSASRAVVPLTSRGLPGPPVVWRKDVECVVSRRVLVRVRARLEGTQAWRRTEVGYVGARGEVLSGSLAVREQRTGAPVAYVELAAGTARLWHASRCS